MPSAAHLRGEGVNHYEEGVHHSEDAERRAPDPVAVEAVGDGVARLGQVGLLGALRAGERRRLLARLEDDRAVLGGALAGAALPADDVARVEDAGRRAPVRGGGTPL